MTAGFAPPPPPPPPAAAQPHRSNGGGIALVIVGAIAALLSLGLLAGGSVLMYADHALRDASGFLTSPVATVSAADYAIAATDVTVALPNPAWHVPASDLGSVRVTATGGAAGVFLGIAPSSDVQGYLSGVAYDEPSGWLGSGGTFSYRVHSGGAPATAPQNETFWVASVSGEGAQTLTWKATSGRWAIVLMNADGSRGVTAHISIAATAPFLFGLALGLLIGGGVLLVVAAILLIGGVLLLRPDTPGSTLAWGAPAGQGIGAYPPPSGALGLSYPLRLEGSLDAVPSRWLWLVKWLLLIPHFVILAFLFAAAFVLTVVAFFAILVTGRYPRAIFDFNVGVLRWWWRVSFYGYSALGTDRYPPFSLEAAVDYPATLEVPYPERLSRGLVLVKWWLLAIPHYLIVAILAGGSTLALNARGYAYEVPYTGLITVLVIIAAVAVLFTARYPRGLFDLVMGLNRWVYRVLIYVLLMRDEYPPFRLDLGGSEPMTTPAGPAPAPPVPVVRPRPFGVG